MNKTAVFLLIICFLIGCAQQPMDVAKAKEEIAQLNAKFAEAMNNGDGAAIAALYADNATIMPPNSEPVTGKEAIEQLWAGMANWGIKDFILTTTDLSGAGNMAYETGAYSLSMGETKDAGKYLVVWQKQQDGNWKIQADIWNSSMPMPGAEMKAE